jgi:CubicO group peptidase (beta-lactamase class C family)
MRRSCLAVSRSSFAAGAFVGFSDFVYVEPMSARHVVSFVMVAAVLAAGCSGSESTEDTAAASEQTTSTPEATVTDPPATEPVTTDPAVTDPVVSEPVETDPPPEPEVTAAAERAPYDFSAIGPIVDAFVAEQGLNGAGLIVVDQEDGVVHEEYWGEFGADRISLIASSSKMVSASVLMRLDDDGLLDVDAPVADVVEWGAGNPTVTPAQLISNSSGLIGLLDGFQYESYLCQFIPDGTLQDCAEQIFTTPDDDAAVIPPDTEFRYGGAQWTIAGAVAEAASGQTWAQLVDDLIATPCGLESLGYNILRGFEYPVGFNGDPSTLPPTDNPNPGGGAYVTAPDYAQLMLMQLRGGMCGDERVVSSEAIDRMHADRIAEVYGGDAGELRPTFGYGMGWWVNRESGRINDEGLYGTVPWLDVDDGFGAYLVVEATSAVGSSLADQLYEPVEAAVLAAR